MGTQDTAEIKTQKDAVIFTLEKNGSMTSWEAFTDWGITRLAAIVRTLKKDHGMEIASVDVQDKNRFGHTVVYTRYEYKKPEPQMKLNI